MKQSAIIIFLLICHLKGASQMVLSYEENLESSQYQDFLEREETAMATIDLQAKGILFYKLANHCVRYEEDLSLEYGIKAVSIFESLGDDYWKHKASCNLALPYIHTGRYDEAEPLIEKGLAYWIKVGNQKEIANTYSKKAYLLDCRGDIVKSLDYILKCYKIQKATSLIREMGATYMSIGNTYAKIGDCETALKYYNEYLDDITEEGTHFRKLTMMEYAIICLKKTGNLKLAQEYERQVAGRWAKSSSFKLKSRSYSDLSNEAIKNEKYQLANTYQDSALYFALLFKNKKRLCDVEEEFFHLFLIMGRKESAVIHLNRALDYANESNYLYAQERIYQHFSKFYKNAKNYKLSLNYLALSDSIKTIYLSTEMIQGLKRLDIRYQQEQNEKEIAFLETENNLKAVALENEKNVKLTLGILLLTSLGFLILLYFLLRTRSKSAKTLAEKNSQISKAFKANKMLTKEIHHRVKNNLQVVSSLLFLQSRFIKDDSAKGAIRTGRTRVQAMSILHQKLYQNENIKNVNIKYYFEDLSENLFDSYKIDDDLISLITDVEDLELDIDTVVPLGLITNELISNALKHAFEPNEKGTIILTIAEVDNVITLMVSDSGKGLPFSEWPEKLDSLGMDLIKSFAEKLEADIRIDNSNGSTIKISFKNQSDTG